ncbi:cytosine deaminase [Sulfobacillus acidophilus TPY]|uniref:Cytosine deaminase n=1 Tax=Sulfobacillus acidophilus (strain ATCC 700253 / DSM 10332 / NAL) TaxID=679936 RepID=G8TUR0_SULAD|nr:cytosine deaminase [Sulfobacillus acidophilus TPY]AEW05784.1 Cytosine deaminase [Sulfobacillus acidophilus DSM 10332]
MGQKSTLIQNARLPNHSEPVDILLSDARIQAIGRGLTADTSIDAAGGLVLPALVDPHIHLDAVLTEGEPEPNRSGTLIEGIERWSQRKERLSVEDVLSRAEEAVWWHVGHGVLKIRSHVDVSDPSLTALKALIQLREKLKPWVTLELVAFPQDSIFGFPHGPELMEEALVMGADVVGGIPHYEWTREDGIRDVELAFHLAQKYHKAIDIHCDETDDDQSRFLETMAKLTWEHHLGSRVTASHTTALGSYNDAYAFKLIRYIAKAGMNIVANPLDNIVLQGRFDTYPKRRGMTRVKELIQAGVTVAAGHDSIMDPWYPLGEGNQLFVASMLAHIGQLTGSTELPWAIDSITQAGARVMGLADYGVHAGAWADVIVLPVPSPADAIRLMPRPRWVISRGRIIAETIPQETRVWLTDEPRTVTYLRP